MDLSFYKDKCLAQMEKFEPVALTTKKQPFDSPDYIYEIKYDGFRCLSFKKEKDISLISRNLNTFTQFDCIKSDLKTIEHTFVLDGELVALDENGNVDFNLLLSYTPKSKCQVSYFVFDILYLDGYDLKHLTLVERKEILRELLKNTSASIQFVDHIEEHGSKLFDLVSSEKMEGIVAKKKTSIYVPGKRTKNWIKIKTKYWKAPYFGNH